MKWFAIAAVMASSLYPASAQNYNAFGDSITIGHGVPAGDDYISLLNTATGFAFVNHGVSGAMAGDQAPLIYAVTPGAGDIATIMIGVNDQSHYGTNPTTLGYYRAIVQDMAAYLATPSKLLARGSGITYTGSWGNSSFISMSTNTNGASATFNFSGTALYIDTIFYTLATGTADVYVDNVRVGSFTSDAPGIATKNGASYMPALVRFGGLVSGAHVGRVVVTSASGGTNYIYLNWVGGNAQTVFPQVYVAGPTRFAASGYAAAGGSDANVTAYNATIASLVADLAGDGLAVFNVDTVDAVDPATQLQSDGIHPNQSGHTSLEAAFYAAINVGVQPVVTFTQTGVWIGSDGTLCISPVQPTSPCARTLH